MSYYVSKSKIHGLGVLADTNIKRGHVIDIGIDYYLHLIPYVTPNFGSYINHKSAPNTMLRYMNNAYYVIAIEDINRGCEITIDYDTCPWFINGSRSWYL